MSFVLPPQGPVEKLMSLRRHYRLKIAPAQRWLDVAGITPEEYLERLGARIQRFEHDNPEVVAFIDTPHPQRVRNVS